MTLREDIKHILKSYVVFDGLTQKGRIDYQYVTSIVNEICDAVNETFEASEAERDRSVIQTYFEID